MLQAAQMVNQNLGFTLRLVNSIQAALAYADIISTTHRTSTVLSTSQDLLI